MTKPNMKPIFDRFYAQAEEAAKEAQALDADARHRAQIVAQETKQDAQDRAALAEMEQQVEALQSKVKIHAEDLAAKRGELQEIERQRDEKTAEAEAVVAIVEREKARLAAEIEPPVRLPGVAPVDGALNGSPLDTRDDVRPPVTQDGSQP
jgi:hypothetical protein